LLMDLSELRVSGIDQISSGMRRKAEKLLINAGKRIDPFEGKYLAGIRRLISAGLNYPEARRRNVPVEDLTDYLRLALPVKDSDGRTDIVTLWSETLNPEESPIRMKRGVAKSVELTQRGGAVIWDFETQVSYSPPSISAWVSPSYSTRIEVHKLVQSEVSEDELLLWQDTLNSLAREAFKTP
jgi:hypothetical protein